MTKWCKNFLILALLLCLTPLFLGTIHIIKENNVEVGKWIENDGKDQIQVEVVEKGTVGDDRIKETESFTTAEDEYKNYMTKLNQVEDLEANLEKLETLIGDYESAQEAFKTAVYDRSDAMQRLNESIAQLKAFAKDFEEPRHLRAGFADMIPPPPRTFERVHRKVLARLQILCQAVDDIKSGRIESGVRGLKKYYENESQDNFWLDAAVRVEKEVIEEQRRRIAEHVFYGFPSRNCHLLTRIGYVLCYNERTKVADWTTYHLTAAYLLKRAHRENDFRPDTDISSGKRSELADYIDSGYDRGHLVPAGDMVRDKEAMSESFLLTNMAPQIGPGFNRGIWSYLEKKVRHWTSEGHDLYVMTGPVYLDEAGNPIKKLSEVKTIGPGKVAIPTHFYKIIVSVDNMGQPINVIAFILPNQRNANQNLPRFMTSIVEIEKTTGLDFMHDLDDSIEKPLESGIERQLWH